MSQNNKLNHSFQFYSKILQTKNISEVIKDTNWTKIVGTKWIWIQKIIHWNRYQKLHKNRYDYAVIKACNVNFTKKNKMSNKWCDSHTFIRKILKPEKDIKSEKTILSHKLIKTSSKKYWIEETIILRKCIRKTFKTEKIALLII